MHTKVEILLQALNNKDEFCAAPPPFTRQCLWDVDGIRGLYLEFEKMISHSEVRSVRMTLQFDPPIAWGKKAPMVIPAPTHLVARTIFRNLMKVIDSDLWKKLVATTIERRTLAGE